MHKTLFSYLPVLFLALGTAVGLTVSTLKPNPPHAELNVFQIAQRQTVLVVVPDGQGSAVIVKRSNRDGATRWFAWTAAHVVEKQTSVKVKVILRTEGRKVGETVYTARVLGISPETDCALLFIDAPPEAFTPAIFASSTPATPGDPVFACGNFLGDNFDGSISTGVISQIGVQPTLQGWPAWRVVDQSTSPAYPGSSGGPLFNARGEVLGLVVGGVNATLNVFVPVRALEQWASIKFAWALRGDYCPLDAFLTSVVPVAPVPVVLAVPVLENNCN